MQQSLFAQAVPVEEKPSSVSQQEVLIDEAVFTVIDVETTGLSAKKNALTEVTAIQYRQGKEIGKFSTLVQPTEPIPQVAIDITGITNEMVANAPPLITVLSDLSQFVGESPWIVGHNVPFDIQFICEKLNQCQLTAFIQRFELSRGICTKALAVKAFPDLPSYEGIVVANRCDVHNPNPHRAEADVRMSAGILFAILEYARKEGHTLRTMSDLLAYQGDLS